MPDGTLFFREGDLRYQQPRSGQPELATLAGMATPAPRDVQEGLGAGTLANIPDTSISPSGAIQEPGTWVYDFDPGTGSARATFNGEVSFISGGSSTAVYLPLTGGTLTGSLTIAPAGGWPTLACVATTSTACQLIGYKGTAASSGTRWTVLFGNQTTEASGNVGNDFAIQRYDNTGTYLDQPFLITRSTGNVSIAQNLYVTGTVQGAYLYSTGDIRNIGNTYSHGGVIAGGGDGTGNGYIQLMGGGTTNTGYVNFYFPNGSRAGYVGYASAGGGQLNFTCNENGATGLLFNGNVVANNNLTAQGTFQSASTQCLIGSVFYKLSTTGALTTIENQSGTALQVMNNSGGAGTSVAVRSDTTNTHLIDFINTSTTIGSINNTGSGVTYGTSSDVRLKELFGEARAEDLTFIERIKIYDGRFKPVIPASELGADGRPAEHVPASIRHPMWLAHELQEVYPLAVTGKRDAVDANGNIVPMMTDASRLVPALVAYVQQLARRVRELEAVA